MPVRITAKNTKVSDRVREHIENAYDHLHKYYDRIIDCEVVVEKSGHRAITVEFKVKVPQHTLVATATSEGDNLYKAVDEASDKVEVQVKKHHDRQVEHR